MSKTSTLNERQLTVRPTEFTKIPKLTSFQNIEQAPGTPHQAVALAFGIFEPLELLEELGSMNICLQKSFKETYVSAYPA